MSVTRRSQAAAINPEGDNGDNLPVRTPRQPVGDETSPVHRLEQTMTELGTRVRRLGRAGACILGVSVLLSFLLYWQLISYAFITRHTEDVYFLKMETCPACYGNDFCHHFTNSEVTFSGAYQYPIVHRLSPTKRVFEGRRGRYKGHPVVIKSLATPEQLGRVQSVLCQYSNLQGTRHCNMRDALWKRLPMGEDTLTLYDLREVNDMFRCPSDRLVTAVKDAFRLRDPEKPSRLLRNEEMSLFFTALVNPEPLVLMTFTSEKGWPFPKYYGACGRFIVVEHRGQPATEFASAKLSDRLLVSKRILELALRLTSSDTKFALYLNDWDLGNFAVYPDTRTVALVDLSNVTVVDTLQVAPATSQHHVTSQIGSQSADAKAVCKHQLSDWNLFGACDMLARTLLSDSLGAGSKFGQQLSQCAAASQLAGAASRFQLVKAVISALDEMH